MVQQHASVAWVDQWTLDRIKQEKAAYAGIAEWLATYKHECYIVLTFGRWLSSDRAQWYVKEWFAELTEHYPRLNAYVSYDRGAGTNRLNVHLLIGGLWLHKRPRDQRLRALKVTHFLATAKHAWQRGQMVKGEPYYANRGAISYMAQYHADANLPPAEIFGRMLKKRKRRHHKTRGAT